MTEFSMRAKMIENILEQVQRETGGRSVNESSRYNSIFFADLVPREGNEKLSKHQRQKQVKLQSGDKVNINHLDELTDERLLEVYTRFVRMYSRQM